MNDATAICVELRLDSRKRGTVAHLTIDNRAKLNALDRALMTEFIDKVEALAARDSLHFRVNGVPDCAKPV
jgi:enoyl-CoA hydratase/carnithine racemase